MDGRWKMEDAEVDAFLEENIFVNLKYFPISHINID
jgi:hypothetical protein